MSAKATTQSQPDSTHGSKPEIAFLGLGAMGIGTCTHLLKSGYSVTAFDPYPNPAATAALKAAGGTSATSPRAAAASKPILILMVATLDHVVTALLAPETGAVHDLPRGATVIIHATIPPNAPESIRQRLADEFGRPDIRLIDAPVSGGAGRAADGTLTVMISAVDKQDVERQDVKAVLECASGKVDWIEGGLGSALRVKALNQVLCASHVVATGEMMGLACALGVGAKGFYEEVVRLGADGKGKGPGWSWMFEDRGNRMLDPDPPMRSAMAIILKDVRIVVQEGERVGIDLQLCRASRAVYEKTVEMGLERADDSTVVEAFLSDWKKDWKEDWRESAEGKARVDAEEEKKLRDSLVMALASINAMASFEAFSFAKGLGMTATEVQKEQWYHILASAAAGSTMFIEGMPNMLKSATAQRPVEVLVPGPGDPVKGLETVIDLATKNNYSPKLLPLALKFFQAAHSGSLTHEGSQVKLVAQSPETGH